MMLRKQLLIATISLIIGFFIGRSASAKKEVIKYIKGKEVTASVDVSGFKVGREITEFKTNPVNLPSVYWNTDTLFRENTIYIKQEIDTVEILAEFLTKREYNFNVFDNEHGKLDIRQSIQYNKLVSFDYSFVPIQKLITHTKQDLFMPFVSTSYNTLNYVGTGGGVFIKDFALEYNYLHNFSENINAHFFGVKYKF